MFHELIQLPTWRKVIIHGISAVEKKLINVIFSYLQKPIIHLFVQLFGLGNLRHSCNVLTCNRALKLDSRTTKKLNALTTVIEKKCQTKDRLCVTVRYLVSVVKLPCTFFSEEWGKIYVSIPVHFLFQLHLQCTVRGQNYNSLAKLCFL